jgi:hypothetical protein
MVGMAIGRLLSQVSQEAPSGLTRVLRQEGDYEATSLRSMNRLLDRPQTRIDRHMEGLLAAEMRRPGLQEGPARNFKLGGNFEVALPEQRQESVREESVKKTPAEEENKKVGGEMFIEVNIGQGLVDNGKFVMKLSSIYFNLPDMLGQNKKIIELTGERVPWLMKVVGDIVSYNPEDSLVSWRGATREPVNAELLRKIYTGVYEAVQHVVLSNAHAIPEADLDSFKEQHADRMSKVERLVADTLQIFSTPEHSKKRAYRNRSILFQRDRRVELLFDGATAVTMGPPCMNYQMCIYDERLVDKENDHGDTPFMRSRLAFWNMAWSGRFTTIIEVGTNNTATVDRCGGAKDIDIYNFFVNTGINNVWNIQDQNSVIVVNGQVMVQGNFSVTTSITTVASETGSQENGTGAVCTGCGRSRQGQCSCGNAAAHAASRTAVVRGG